MATPSPIVSVQDLAGTYRVVRRSTKNTRVEAADDAAREVFGTENFLVPTSHIQEAPPPLVYQDVKLPPAEVVNLATQHSDNGSTDDEVFGVFWHHRDVFNPELVNQMTVFREDHTPAETLSEFIDNLVTNEPQPPKVVH